jgi:hypothetical protein
MGNFEFVPIKISKFRKRISLKDSVLEYYHQKTTTVKSMLTSVRKGRTYAHNFSLPVMYTAVSRSPTKNESLWYDYLIICKCKK